MYKMDVVNSPGRLFRNEARYKQHGLMFVIAVPNPCSPSPRNDSADSTGCAIANNAIRREHHKCRGAYHRTFEFLPLAFSSAGDHCADARNVSENHLARRKAQESRETSMEKEKALVARETGRLWRWLDHSSYGPLVPH